MANRGEIRVFVPRDTTARSLGADDVAQAIAGTATDRGKSVALVRNGSRGLYWLELQENLLICCTITEWQLESLFKLWMMLLITRMRKKRESRWVEIYRNEK